MWRRRHAQTAVQEVVLPSSFAACQARADAKVFPVPGGDRDPHDINASAQDKSAGKSSQITITNKKGRPSQADIAEGMDHKQVLDPLAQGMPNVMVDTPLPGVADQLRERGSDSQPGIERLFTATAAAGAPRGKTGSRKACP